MSNVPLKEVPGGYGLPLLGSIKDRLDFYWFQGDTEFFQIRKNRYKSSVFRMNYSPGPPFYPDSKGIAFLDQKSFSVLMDNSKVDKTDTLLGPYIPNLKFTGGYRVLPYLDTTEEKHTLYKELVFELLKLNSPILAPEYSRAFKETSAEWEEALGNSRTVDLLTSCDSMITKFLLRSIVHRDPAEPGPASLGKDFTNTYQLWTAINFAGIARTPLPHWLEELLFHTFRLPYFLVSKQYESLSKFYRTYATEALDIAQNKLGLDREETVHHLILILGINGRLGLLKMIPTLAYYISKLGPEFQARLATEVRVAVETNDGKINSKSLLEMPLVKATVLEALRLYPSIFYIYGRAREDLVVESDEAKYQVKKGELMGGHLYFVMRDPKVFEDPDEFIPDRFMGEKGQDLLKHLVWSNGPETQDPSPTNKQCPAKNYAELITCQFVAEMMLKYDSFEVTPESKVSSTELSVSLKSLNTRK